jgi:hypothetical protein
LPKARGAVAIIFCWRVRLTTRLVQSAWILSELMPRVEKMRQTSAVMLDEAAIDPSLRFVLIAIALFVIFVALLFISLLR